MQLFRQYRGCVIFIYTLEYFRVLSAIPILRNYPVVQVTFCFIAPKLKHFFSELREENWAILSIKVSSELCSSAMAGYKTQNCNQNYCSLPLGIFIIFSLAFSSQQVNERYWTGKIARRQQLGTLFAHQGNNVFPFVILNTNDAIKRHRV